MTRAAALVLACLLALPARADEPAELCVETATHFVCTLAEFDAIRAAAEKVRLERDLARAAEQRAVEQRVADVAKCQRELGACDAVTRAPRDLTPLVVTGAVALVAGVVLGVVLAR